MQGPGGFPGGYGYPGAAGAGRRRQWAGAGGPRGEQTMLGLAMLLAQQAAQLEQKPPVTLLLVAAQVLFFLRPEGFEWVPSLRKGCLIPSAVMRGQWRRLLWAPWLHVDALHLFYNMSSLLWKGAQLEPRLGSAAFARLVAELALTSSALYCGAAAALAGRAPLLGARLMRACAAGFSGVLFGLKVVLNHNAPGWSVVAGVRLPTKYVCWAELVYMQLLLPDASFLGHLCGILAGLLYVLLTSRLPLLPGGRPRGGGRARGGGGGAAGGARHGGGGGLSGLLGALLGGRQRRPRTYGHGTWGGGGGSASSGAGARASGQRWG